MAAIIDRLRREDIDTLIGSRSLGGAEGMPAARKAALQVGPLFERAWSGMALTDAHNGLPPFTRRFTLQVDVRSCDMSCASEITPIVRSSGLHYGEHPVTVDSTRHSLAKGQPAVDSINIAADWRTVSRRLRA